MTPAGAYAAGPRPTSLYGMSTNSQYRAEAV